MTDKSSFTPPQATGSLMDELRRIEDLDADRGLALSAGRETLYVSILGKFAAAYPDFGSTLASMLRDGDNNGATHFVHQLKGSAGQIGATRVHANAKALEEILRASAMPPALPEALIAETGLAIANLSAALSAILHRNTATPAQSPATSTQVAEACARLEASLVTGNPDSHRLLLDEAAVFRDALGEHYVWICQAAEVQNFSAALDWYKEARRR